MFPRTLITIGIRGQYYFNRCIAPIGHEAYYIAEALVIG